MYQCAAPSYLGVTTGHSERGASTGGRVADIVLSLLDHDAKCVTSIGWDWSVV